MCLYLIQHLAGLPDLRRQLCSNVLLLAAHHQVVTQQLQQLVTVSSTTVVLHLRARGIMCRTQDEGHTEKATSQFAKARHGMEWNYKPTMSWLPGGMRIMWQG